MCAPCVFIGPSTKRQALDPCRSALYFCAHAFVNKAPFKMAP